MRRVDVEARGRQDSAHAARRRRRGHGASGGARQLSAGRQDGHAARHGARALRRRAIQSELRRTLSRRQSAVRHRREAHGAAELDLRREHGRAGDEGRFLQAAIAARDAALDRSRLASSVVPSRKESRCAASRGSAGWSAAPDGRREPTRDDSSLETRSVPFVVTLPLRAEAPPPRVARAIPDVRGLDLRDAVRSLHSAGFRVQLARAGGGTAGDEPRRAGELAPTGTLIRLHLRLLDARRHRHDRAGARRGRTPRRAPRRVTDHGHRTSPTTVAPCGPDTCSSPFAGASATVTTISMPRRQAGATAAIVQDADAHVAAGARRQRRPSRRGDRRRPRRTDGRRATFNSSASPARTARRPPSTCCATCSATARAQSASIGTLGVLVGSEGTPLEGGGGLTTPGPIELQRLFRALRDDGVRRVAMEVSSHSLRPAPRRGRVRSTSWCSRTSRATISTITARWTTTSPRRRCSLDHLLPHGDGRVEPRRRQAWSRCERTGGASGSANACRPPKSTPRTFASVRAAAS